jgi:hypothetical protein
MTWLFDKHKQFGIWIETKTRSAPVVGRRRPQYNTDLLATQIVLKLLGIK